MIRPTPEPVGSASNTAVDPMSDIAAIVDEALLAGLDQRLLAFACVYMRFAQRAPWEQATKSATSSWGIAAYSTGQGHMLRLSRKAHPTARDLAQLRTDALTFAHTHAADWLSMSIEDLQQAPTAWQKLTAHAEISLPEQRTSPDIENDIQVLRLQRGGTA